MLEKKKSIVRTIKRVVSSSHKQLLHEMFQNGKEMTTKINQELQKISGYGRLRIIEWLLTVFYHTL